MPRMAAGPPAGAGSPDELPQSGSGKTIMTTQPKFVPSEAVSVTLEEQSAVRVRMVDSVGYLVQGALGTRWRTAQSRMVHTPWFDQDVPFEQAAEIGTRKVITDHATIGHGGHHRRHHCRPAPERIRGGRGSGGAANYRRMGKPFVIVLNCRRTGSAEALRLLRAALEEPLRRARDCC